MHLQLLWRNTVLASLGFLHICIKHSHMDCNVNAHSVGNVQPKNEPLMLFSENYRRSATETGARKSQSNTHKVGTADTERKGNVRRNPQPESVPIRRAVGRRFLPQLRVIRAGTPTVTVLHRMLAQRYVFARTSQLCLYLRPYYCTLSLSHHTDLTPGSVNWVTRSRSDHRGVVTQCCVLDTLSLARYFDVQNRRHQPFEMQIFTFILSRYLIFINFHENCLFV